MKTLFGDRRIWIPIIALVACWILGSCTNPKPRPAPTPRPSPSSGSHSKGKKPKTPPPPKSPAPPRFTEDAAGNQLQKLISTPAGLARLRAWMNANGLQNEAVELLIRADIYASQRKKAASALVP